MSWFDTAGFASLAKSALNTAQKTIDRALDIQDDGTGAPKPPKPKLGSPTKEVEGTRAEEDGFFSSFGLPASEESTSKQPAKISSPSSPEKAKVEEISPEQSETPSPEKPSTSSSGMWGDWGSFYLPKLQSPQENQISESEIIVETELPILLIPDDSAVLPDVKEEAPSTVLLQPQAEKLFPDNQDNSQEDSSVDVSNDVLLQPNKAVQNDSSEELTIEMVTESKSPISVSLLLSEMVPIQFAPSKKDSPIIPIVLNDPTLTVEQELDDDNKNNDSTDTLRDLSDDDDDDETEEELTVMERRPHRLSDRNLDLPITPCFKNNDASPTDYCFVDDIERTQSESPLKADFEKDMSLSTSMEIISGSETTLSINTILQHTEQRLQSHTPSYENFSSPDSVVPIQDEPLSNLPSPHFPDIHINAPSSSKFLSLPLDMCDSDVTLLSPSAGEEDSTDSEKDAVISRSGLFAGTEPTEVRECETSSSDSKTSNSSSSGSFVNCSLEDGDPCYATREHSGSSTAASDPLRHETETSGHTSGDDIETTTSSDIEIISPSNGENNSSHPLSPLKHIWVPRPHRTKRSESPASDSSKEGLMPVVHEFEELKDVGASQVSNEDRLLKQLGSLQEVLEAREQRVMFLSKENVELQENYIRIKNQIQRMEETHCKDSEGVSKMTREFSQRLSQLESKLEETIIDRDSLSEQLSNLRIKTASKLSVSEMESLITERDQQILQLMQEGEKLSKQQLNLSNIIKKLRNKEKESETTLKSQKEKLEEQTKDLERLRKSFGAKDDQEKKHIDAIRQLTTTVYKQEEDISMLKNELEDANDKQRSMKTNLDTAYKEMTNAQKKLAEKESEIQEAAISAEMVAKESLRFQLEQVQEQANQERETLLAQVTELRLTLSKVEQQSCLREESLRMDIANLQRRLEDADSRNDELTQSVSCATRPLLRQLENLQSIHSNQTASWDKIEKSLNERLASSQNQLSIVKEKERILEEQARELASKVSALEIRNKAISHEKIQLTSQVEVLKAKIALNEESKHRDAKSVSSLKQKFAEEITQLKKEKEEARQEIDVLKMELDRVKQLEILTEELTEEIPGGRSSPSLSMTLSHHSSVSETFKAWGQDGGSEINYDLGTRPSVHEQWWGGSASTMIETLQSQVKLREGEIQQLQREINQLERVRESMVEELGNLARKLEEQEIPLSDLQTLKDSFKDTEQKYNTLLQMYGEKVEEAEELRLDLTDVKAMYKAQIEELLKKS